MEFCFNPIHNKNPQGPCIAGDLVTYTLKIARHHQLDSVFFVMIDDQTNITTKTRMPLHSCDESYHVFEITMNFKKAGLFWYYFEIINKDNNRFYLCKTPSFDVEPVPDVRASFAQVVNLKMAKVDEKYHQGIIYHVFVDRFKKSGDVICKEGMLLREDWGGEITKNANDFLVINQECFGGNLQGITEKLPYIKSLGTSTILLSPIFESYSYHKYDIANYEQVESMFGGWKALKKLTKEAQKYDIKVLLDGVFNHVGSDSIYFNKLGRHNSIGAYQGKQSQYYDWFSFENFPDKYSSWWGIDTLPQLNKSNPNLQAYIAGQNGILEKYLDTGILGFRLDVVDELDDLYLNKICSCIKNKKPDALIMGEVWEDAATKIAYEKRRHYFQGSQLNSVMNYPLRNAIIKFVSDGTAQDLANTFFMLKDHYPADVLQNLMNFLGTHDTKRILTVFAEQNKQIKPIQLLKIASAIQYCAPGVPAVFYGDEAGAEGGDAPFCRICFPWGKENKQILSWYQKLGKLREDDVFINGECNVLLAHNGVFIFERKNKDTRIIIAANCGPDDFQLNIKTPMEDFETSKVIKNFALLSPLSFAILKTIPTIENQ